MSQAGRSSAEDVSLSRNDGKKHLLLAASGSVATIKIPNIIQGLSQHKDLSIRLVLTSSAAQFLKGQAEEQPSLADIAKMPNVDGIYEDEDEWAHPWTRGAPILHIEMRRWADVLVIAPLSANTMANIVAGTSSNLLTSVVRAWDTDGLVDGQRKKIIMATAMNTAMWKHPVTGKHLKILEDEWGGENGWVEVLRPVEKELACGDVGQGAMVPWQSIVENIQSKLSLE